MSDRLQIDPLKIDPVPLNCPRCGEQMVHVRNEGAWGIYKCSNDGVVLHPVDGKIRIVLH